MRLTKGQMEYMLELLSGEYFLPKEYQIYVKDAVKHYGIRRYSEEELDFLVSLPQSLTADFYLNQASFKQFCQRFLLWVNVLEYAIYDERTDTIAFLPNPDWSSPYKLFKITCQKENIQIVAVPLIALTNTSKAKIAKTNKNGHFLTSHWEEEQIRELLEDFLAFAKRNTLKIPHDGSDYLSILEDNIKRTKEMRTSWLKLRENAPCFTQIEPNYTFSQRDLGLITPSNIEFISLLNSRSKTRQRQNAPAVTNPFAPEIRLLQKFKSSFKSSSPCKVIPKNNGRNTFKLPNPPFNLNPFNFNPPKAPHRCPRYQPVCNNGQALKDNTDTSAQGDV